MMPDGISLRVHLRGVVLNSALLLKLSLLFLICSGYSSLFSLSLGFVEGKRHKFNRFSKSSTLKKSKKRTHYEKSAQ